MLKKIFFCVFTFINLISAFSNGTPDSENKNKSTVIKFAYSWGQGFNNTLADYAENMKEKFVLESEQNIGLDHKQKILVDVASNNIPDVFLFWSYEANLGYLARNGYIINIEEYFKETKKHKKSDFLDWTFDATKIDGKHYAIPIERFFGFWAVNESIFKKYKLSIPKTWDDIKRISPILLKNGITPLAMGSYRGDPGHLFFSVLSYQDPNGYRDAKNIKHTNNFKYPGTRLAAQAALDLISYGAIPKVTVYSGPWDEQIMSYNQEKTAMIYSFSWVLALFTEEIAQKSIIIPPPKISSNVVDPGKFTVGGVAQNICINADSWKNPEKRKAIVELVDWILSEEVFMTRLNQVGTFPTKKMDIPEMRNPIYRKVMNFVKGQEVYEIHEFFFNSLAAFNTYKEANDLLWANTITKEEFLNMVQDGMVRK
jgi:raffinose/stachyose/melibiose transport system substrate-binding protein